MTAELLQVEDLWAAHAGVPAVRGLTMRVAAGEIVALLGANGAGKTTTLRTISGLLPALRGDVRVMGRSNKGRKPHQIARDGVAHVTEDRSIFEGLTVAENLELGRRGGPLDVAEAARHFPELLPLMQRRAGLLSGGEQKMLALARALAARPALLLLDELSLGLAPAVVRRALSVLRQVVTETGLGVLLVEQYVHLALDVADRAYLLASGELALQGAPSELAARRDLIESSYLGEAR